MIAVRPVSYGPEDAYGNMEKSYGVAVEVPGAWAAPSSTASMAEDGRPHLVENAVDIYVPKDRPDINWREALVALDGLTFFWKVDGDPMPYPPEMTPGRYNLVVTARRTDG